MTRLIMCMLAAAVFLASCDKPESYVFRNDDRPMFDETVDVDALKTMTSSGDVTVLDVRLREDYEADPTLIPGALYKDPEQIQAWASEIPNDKPVVVYCVKGKWVSQKAANYLDAQGREVYSLDGGIEAWKAAD